MKKICIKNGILVSMSKDRPILENNMDILIEDDTIKEISNNIVVDENTTIIDATNKIIMPGLIDTHAHVPMSIFRETVDGLNLQDWLTKSIWPKEDKLTNEDIYYASYLSFLEMIKCGTTTINDMYFMTEDIISSAIKSGIRLQTTRTLMGSKNNPDDLKKIEELDNLIKNNQHERITYNIGIHGLYTSDPGYIEECIKYANTTKIPIHMHFCENQTEVNDIKRIYNDNPSNVLLNMFSNQSILLAHCVELNTDDIKKISTLDISVSHCPVSNLKLGCGIADIYEMQKNNINVSLGTDGQGSGCNLDMFETMKYTALLQKGLHKDPKLFPAYEILKLATINGAKALHLDKYIGSIEINKKADIIILNLNDIKLSPLNDIISEIVYNVKSNNVETTIINGNILMLNHKLQNDIESEIITKCEDIINRIA